MSYVFFSEFALYDLSLVSLICYNVLLLSFNCVVCWHVNGVLYWSKLSLCCIKLLLGFIKNQDVTCDVHNWLFTHDLIFCSECLCVWPIDIYIYLHHLCYLKDRFVGADVSTKLVALLYLHPGAQFVLLLCGLVMDNLGVFWICQFWKYWCWCLGWSRVEWQDIQ